MPDPRVPPDGEIDGVGIVDTPARGTDAGHAGAAAHTMSAASNTAHAQHDEQRTTSARSTREQARDATADEHAASQAGERPLARGEPGVELCQALPLPKFSPSQSMTHMDVVRRADDKVKRKAQRIVDRAMDGARLDDEGAPVDGTAVDTDGRPVGWDGVRYNVARDARRPIKQQPGYLAMAARVLDSYRKADADRTAAPELQADIRVYVQQNVYNYPVRDVTGKE